jgi:putative phage-type endonuclease
MKVNKTSLKCKILEIYNFFGLNHTDLIDKGSYKSLKKDICLMYEILYDKKIDSNLIDNLFNIKYQIKNSNSLDDDEEECITSCDSSILQIDLKVKNDTIIPSYLDNSEDDTIDVITNIIETYKELSVLEKTDKSIDNKINFSKFLTVEQREEEYNKLINNLKPSLIGDLKKKADHFDYLRDLPQPVQKSKEWFDLRNGMITASSAAEILGESKYGTRDQMLLDKVGILPNKYSENMFVHHGKKYELIATMIYEHLFNTKVGEFGLIPYQNDHTDKEIINFMGASPDGISTCITLDGKPNSNVGKMLEIKCPLKRKISTHGEIDGEICPHYYWVQVQVQLACCKNDECDFWQCNIQEYDEDRWTIDNTEDEKIECLCTVEQNMTIKIDNKITKGLIIQLLPKDKSEIPKGDRWEWYAKYIYPSNLMMTDKEYIEWSLYMEKEWKNLYPEYENKYYFDRILYWKLQSSHNVLIKRDIEWFNSKVPVFKQFWNDVIQLRNDEKKSSELLNIYLSKSKQKVKKEYTPSAKKKNPYNDDMFVDSDDDNQMSNIKDNNLKRKTSKTEIKNIFIKPKETKISKKSKLLDEDYNDEFLSASN